MTDREKFLDHLTNCCIEYRIDDDDIIICGNFTYTYNYGLSSIPDNVVFDDVSGDVYLPHVVNVGKNVEFKNKGNVFLDSLELTEEFIEKHINKKDTHIWVIQAI